EPAGRCRGASGALDLAERPLCLGARDLLPLGLADPLEHVAHGGGSGAGSVGMVTLPGGAGAALPPSVGPGAGGGPAPLVRGRPPTTSAAPAFSSTMSRIGPFSPLSRALMRSAFSAGSLPAMALRLVRGKPSSSGFTSKLVTLPSFNSATTLVPVVVSSSMPSPCTTQARSLPSLPSTSASGRPHSCANTPSHCRLRPPGSQ